MYVVYTNIVIYTLVYYTYKHISFTIHNVIELIIYLGVIIDFNATTK